MNANPPGLPAIDYRAGTHATFLAALLRAFGADPVLRALGTHDGTEPLVATADAYSMGLDVLTFYTERIANEGYLRTATERYSVLELARAIGYELRPGVAASTALAFTLAKPVPVPHAPGVEVPTIMHAVTAPEKITIPVGTRAQSVPGPGELPRAFETVEEIEARPEWNAIKVPVTMWVPPALGDDELYLKGITTGLNPGDMILLVGNERLGSRYNENWDVRRVAGVRAVDRVGDLAEHTVVTLDMPLGTTEPLVHPTREGQRVYAFRQRGALFGHNAPPWESLPVSMRYGEMAQTGGGPHDVPHWVPGAYAGRQDSWADAYLSATQEDVFLDRVYQGLTPASWIALATPSYIELFRVEEVDETSRADYLLQGQVSRLKITGEHLNFFSPRNAVVWCGAEELELAERPLYGWGGGTVVPTNGVPGVVPGRLVAVRGELLRGGSRSEVARVASVVGSTLVLETGVASYVPVTVRLNANVAAATDGESRTEILGGGDGAAAFQTFTLRGTPLTYTSASTPSGTRSSLEVRVDGLLWTEVPSLYGQGPTARVYTTRRRDDATTVVRFGDGVTGARLPTGRENVRASYRVGIGAAGNVAVDKIALPMSRPLGVEEVINPVAALGGTDPEVLGQARANAPTTVLTLDRIVSLRDYEDFARSFAGIGKAHAHLAWNGERQVIRLVAATTAREPVLPGTVLHDNLRAGIDAARHPGHQVVLETFVPRPFTVVMRLVVEPGRAYADVSAAVTASLVDTFSFEKRAFGQRVSAAEVLAVAQNTLGVRGADLDVLSTGSGGLAVTLPAAPVELLTLRAENVQLTELREPLP
ncbi:putative baseplate assembly protein [Actinorhabdospora filicis]|uniref:Baseplate assembly protein n=1 Tax=Actinorhabdospora filicis TaxID=1785913 RepID=A0A9W6SRB8_9ACTN|nr:putative baseplate assembly protein [Actinorhabdospora filicis]GLZ81520.1 putative baseplate assembly protein [Actinorhabdospora filicis]